VLSAVDYVYAYHTEISCLLLLSFFSFFLIIFFLEKVKINNNIQQPDLWCIAQSQHYQLFIRTLLIAIVLLLVASSLTGDRPCEIFKKDPGTKFLFFIVYYLYSQTIEDDGEFRCVARRI
jgi:hypothetical protein